MGVSTKIEIFSNLSYPLDNSHVRRFASKQLQTVFFDNLPKTVLEDYVYTRVDNYDFTFNVTGKIQGSQRWGYMRIKNLFDGDRWYYCFVNKVEYVDDNTVKVFGSLDFYQTYVFDITILESLVERQHERLYESNGLPVLNTVDEGLNYGLEYVTRYASKVSLSDLYYLVIVSTKEIGDSGLQGGIKYVGTPTPLYYYLIPYDFTTDKSIQVKWADSTRYVPNIYEIFKLLQGDSEYVNSIVSLYVTTFTGLNFQDNYSNGIIDLDNQGDIYKGVRVSKLSIEGTDNSLIEISNVKNFVARSKTVAKKYENVPNYFESKLKMYPYTVIVLSDMKGNQIEIKPEFLSGEDIVIRFQGSVGNENKVGYYLANYLSPSEAREKILIDVSPNNIPIVTEATADYIQGNQNSIKAQKELADSNRWVDIGSSVVNAIPLMMLPQTAPLGIAQATTGIAQAENRRYNDLKMLNAKKKDIDNIPPNAQNMSGNTAYEWGNGLERPWIYIKTVTDEYEKKLSDFFHIYGYQVNELRMPNLATRKYFNYVKCQSLNVRSGLNREIILRFKAIFENGVTLWHTDDIQNYDVVNEVTS